MSKLTRKDLLKMLAYCRPAWSKTEAKFIRRYIDAVPGMYTDDYGNRILACEDSKILIACHTDTVHRQHGKQLITMDGDIAKLSVLSGSNCLGADDTAGVYAALRMIEAGVKATFIFHRAEEIGGRGSAWLADKYPKWLKGFDVCLSLDRRGTGDIITSQWGARTASDAFATSLADALGMGHKPVPGVFTDSANYVELIPECSNISVGYEREHSSKESLDVAYMERLIERLIAIDWSALTVARDPKAIEGFDDMALFDIDDGGRVWCDYCASMAEVIIGDEMLCEECAVIAANINEPGTLADCKRVEPTTLRLCRRKRGSIDSSTGGALSGST